MLLSSTNAGFRSKTAHVMEILNPDHVLADGREDNESKLTDAETNAATY
jgi:hypothetical protein